jgi:hypothetical protein
MTTNIKALKKSESKPAQKGRIPEGTHSAVIIQVVMMGDHMEKKFESEEEVLRNKMLLVFEVPDETFNNDEGEELSRVVSKHLTVSFHEKANLTKVLGALCPKASDLSELLGQHCMIEVGTTKKGNAKAGTVLKPIKGLPVPKTRNPHVFYDCNAPDTEAFKLLYDWTKEVVEERVVDNVSIPNNQVEIDDDVEF